MLDLRTHLEQRIATALENLSQKDSGPIRLGPPKNPEHGDVALGCFQLAKPFGQKPDQVANVIAEQISPDDVVESASATGPFVNFRYQRKALARAVVEGVLRDATPFAAKAPAKDRLLYTSPSPRD